MGDDSNVPLTPAERAELERLRAEKARKDRAELERLRRAAAAMPAERSGTPSAREDADALPQTRPRTFGQRMVLSAGQDKDGLPAMPPAQKIIIGLCLLCVAVALAWIIMTNAGVI
ncbi:hypothetical protein Corgl_0667 [Coriobacterium glomerans PW2]|uniref:Uncharacterized protein n=1 Tax=Coriobacterium glomerans (strain ATCC 49209 / DSM 20642 / JCM 10262 / PW2) TaxID=700015 RepID=F2N7G5_CORGP|nr:hypothetical protein [Coriobacterium glomerans]AEB06781.1 hypothetical protein Corgl_0667 [Coriobacterium glomerans PW2]